MDPMRFDVISRIFASRRTRRSVVTGSSASFAAAVAIAPALGQESTPEGAVDRSDPHPSADTATHYPEFLFVQPFRSGSWMPRDVEDGTYVLTLSGAAASTVYFSDRPERIFGLWPTGDFLDGLGFTPENPPNAALVAQREDGTDQDVLVIELLNPAWDGETLTYEARILAGYDDAGLAHAARQQSDDELPETLAAGSLFIDDCGDGSGQCYQEVNGEVVIVGDIVIGRCLDIDRSPVCGPCNRDGRSSYYGSRCAAAYPDTCSYGPVTINGQTVYSWDCFGRGMGI